MKKIYLPLLVASLVTNTLAMDGIQFGVQGGYGVQTVTQWRTVYNANYRNLIANVHQGRPYSKNDFTGKSGFGGAHLGYGLKLHNFYVGLDLAARFKNMIAQHNEARGTGDNKLAHKRDYAATIDLGAYVNDKTLFYVKSGVVRGEFKFTTDSYFFQGHRNKYLGKTFNKYGFIGGVGLRHQFSKFMDIGLEGSVAVYGPKRFDQAALVATKLKPTVYQCGLRFTFTHNPFSSSSKPKVEAKAKLKK